MIIKSEHRKINLKEDEGILNMVKLYCETKYCSHFDSDKLIIDIQNRVDSTVSLIPHEMLYILIK